MTKTKIEIEADEIPYKIFKNSNLKELSITIDEFDLGAFDALNPNFINKLTKLEKLDLTGVYVSYEIFKNEICKLKHLEELTLMYANLSRIPDEIVNLVNLKELCLRGNNIDSLPVGFDKLTNLKNINLIDNNFKHIPEQLLSIKHLENIDLWDNPLELKHKKKFNSFGEVKIRV